MYRSWLDGNVTKLEHIQSSLCQVSFSNTEHQTRSRAAAVAIAGLNVRRNTIIQTRISDPLRRANVDSITILVCIIFRSAFSLLQQTLHVNQPFWNKLAWNSQHVFCTFFAAFHCITILHFKISNLEIFFLLLLCWDVEKKTTKLTQTKKKNYIYIQQNNRSKKITQGKK